MRPNVQSMEAEKNTHRTKLQAALRATLPEERAAWSAALRRRLQESETWRVSRTVMLFAALRYEPDLLPLLAEEKRFVFPSLENDLIVPRLADCAADLTISPYGIREPDAARCAVVPPAEIDLVLIPGLGFSRDGSRLGRGRGHYDRFLAVLPARTIRCGVCFTCQVSDSLPAETHDIPMQRLLTEIGLEDCGGTSALPRLEIST
jgi:5-formyltetrahydrofolate cyclo-ligase